MNVESAPVLTTCQSVLPSLIAQRNLRVLMITEALDKDSCHLGFVTSWVEGLAARVKSLVVVACFNHGYKPSGSVSVYAASSRPRYVARGIGTMTRIFQMLFLFGYTLRFLLFDKIDVIFAHMNPIFVLFAAPVAKLRKIPILLWYARGDVAGNLKTAHALADCMVSASEESLRIESPKRKVIGHGIDTVFFTPQSREGESLSRSQTILTVGRIAPIKHCDFLIEAFALLKRKDPFENCRLVFVGDIVYATDAEYLGQLQALAQKLGVLDSVEFRGRIRYDEVVRHYHACDIFVNATDPGSVDKAVLEAMACGKPLVTSNTAFAPILGEYAAQMFVPKRDPEEFAKKLATLLQLEASALQTIGGDLRRIVERGHSLDNLCNQLVFVMEDKIKANGKMIREGA